MWISKLPELDPSYVILARPAEEPSVFSTFPPLRYWDVKYKDEL